MGVFQDNETINNKITMLLNNNCEIKSINNNINSENSNNVIKKKIIFEDIYNIWLKFQKEQNKKILILIGRQWKIIKSL